MAKKKMYQRPDGLYEKKITIGGKRVAFRGKTERDVMQKIAGYKEAEDSGPSFSDVCKLYRLKVDAMKPGTQRSYYPAIERCEEEFGRLPIKDISVQDVSRFLQVMSSYGYKTVSNQKTVLNGVFIVWLQNYGKAGDTNPCLYVKLPRGLKRTTRALPDASCVDTVLKCYNDEYGLLPFFYVLTGMRKGEALGLKWGDIDFKKNIIHVRREATHQGARVLISEPKTDAGIRTVPLLTALKNVIQPLRKDVQYYVFGDENPMSGKRYDAQWLAYCKAHGMAERLPVTRKGDKVLAWKPCVTAHQFRHEFCTVMYESGVPEKEAQQIMGHKDPSTMHNIYTHLRSQSIATASQKINKHFDSMTSQNCHSKK